MKRYGWIACLLLIAVLGVSLVLLSTHWGAFVSDDSYYYIKPARDALAGQGFHPSPIFGPTLAVALTLIGWLGIEPLEAVRLLNAVLFGVNILLAGIMLRKMGASDVFSLVAALLLALAENVIEAHAWAMSEALCITFCLLALYFTLFYLKSPRWPPLLVSGLMAALACLTRYAALPVVAVIPLIIVSGSSHQKLLVRLRDAAVFTSISLLPLAGYILRNALILGRPLYYPSYETFPFGIDQVKWYLYYTLSWFIPGRLIHNREIWLALGILVLLVGLGTTFWLRHRSQLKLRDFLTPGIGLLVGFTLFNYLMLFFARGFTALVVYNPRYLTPPLLVFWLALSFWLDRLWGNGGRIAKGLVALVVVGYVAYYGLRATEFVRGMYQTGAGYLNIGWRQSETIPYLQQHPDLPIVATGDVGIYFWTGKLPRVITSFPNLTDMHTYLCQNNGLLVIMSQMPTTIYSLEEPEVIHGLSLVKEFNDSRIFQCNQSP